MFLCDWVKVLLLFHFSVMFTWKKKKKKKKKRDEHTKSLYWFANTYVYSLFHLLVVVEKQSMNWVDLFSLTKKNIVRREKADANLDINFLAFCCRSNTFLFIGSVFTNSQWVAGDYPQRVSLFFARLHIVTSGVQLLSLQYHVSFQLTLFLFSISHSMSKQLFRLSSFQPIRTRCRFTAEKFLFLTQATNAMTTWISASNLSFSYSFLLFHICSFLSHCPVVDQ